MILTLSDVLFDERPPFNSPLLRKGDKACKAGYSISPLFLLERTEAWIKVQGINMGSVPILPLSRFVIALN